LLTTGATQHQWLHLGHLETSTTDPSLVTTPFPPDALQPELTTTCRLLRELGFDSSEANGQALDFLSELRDITVKKDLQLRRYPGKHLPSSFLSL
jgi:hypothetical protein